jgi:hypothetical protein
MPARKATASGKWSQSIWDVTPGVGDDVFANGFTVEIDQNVNVGSLRTTVSGSYAVAGGTFNVLQPYTVTASGGGVIAGTTTSLAVSTSGFDFARVVGPVFGGSSAAAYGVSNAGIGGVTITGTISGGSNATAYGIFNNSVGTVVINGNLIGGSGNSAAPAVFQNSTGTVLVTGTITASVSAHGVVSSNTAARNEFTGTLVNSISGRQAVYCARYLVHPKMFDSATVQAVDRTGTYISYFAPEAYSSTFVPHTSSVALGTAYAAVSSLSGVAVNIPVQLSGTMVVPSAGSVSLGTLVGQTSGTAILNSQDLQNVWNTNINTLTTDGTIFKRLANSATVSDVGTVLQNINL